ncbi:MAG: CBS domain-containing protein [Pseudobdellovibrionaceae bacterium]|nr:CBS domain-containing protein [Bdellovibrionales bacterium]USN48451.1 MAG: CBS domain-containing protein [Pseudobdellovibrionaceae bacterium]
MALLVKDLLPLDMPKVRTLSPDTTVYEAIEILARIDSGALPVVEGGKVLGILSERDYTRKVALENKQSSKILVHEIMSAPVVSVTSETSVEDCLSLMNSKQIRHLPVIERTGELVGFISVLHVISALLNGERQVVSELKEYVSQTWPF